MTTLKFSIVREDAEIERALVARDGVEKGAVLSVASGGCTLFELKSSYPDLRVVGFDLNPTQIEHVRSKKHWIETDDWSQEEDGAFEKLFGVFRHVFYAFISTPQETLAFFEEGGSAKAWFENPYWPVAFKQAFHPDFLFTMFGAMAVQHATRPYASYFRDRFEVALSDANAARNPFLQHILLGRFLDRDAHAHRKGGEDLHVELIEGSIDAVDDISQFDLVSVSNIFDWSTNQEVEEWSDRLHAMKEGSVLLIRQLNNDRALEQFFPDFEFDDAFGEEWRLKDRSFFYERILAGRRR